MSSDFSNFSVRGNIEIPFEEETFLEWGSESDSEDDESFNALVNFLRDNVDTERNAGNGIQVDTLISSLRNNSSNEDTPGLHPARYEFPRTRIYDGVLQNVLPASVEERISEPVWVNVNPLGSDFTGHRMRITPTNNGDTDGDNIDISQRILPMEEYAPEGPGINVFGSAAIEFLEEMGRIYPDDTVVDIPRRNPPIPRVSMNGRVVRDSELASPRNPETNIQLNKTLSEKFKNYKNLIEDLPDLPDFDFNNILSYVYKEDGES